MHHHPIAPLLTPEDLEPEYGELFAAVVRYITRRGYSLAEAEDAAQDAIEALLRRLQAGEVVPYPRRWAQRFAHYQLARERRAQARLVSRVGAGVPYSRTGARRPAAVHPEHMQALQGLVTAEQFAVLALRMAGMSGRDAAKALGLSEAAFWSRLTTARRKLRAAR